MNKEIEKAAREAAREIMKFIIEKLEDYEEKYKAIFEADVMPYIVEIIRNFQKKTAYIEDSLAVDALDDIFHICMDDEINDYIKPDYIDAIIVKYKIDTKASLKY